MLGGLLPVRDGHSLLSGCTKSDSGPVEQTTDLQGKVRGTGLVQIAVSVGE